MVVCLFSTPEGQEWRYGDLPLIQSSEMTGKKFCPVGELTSAKAGEEIWLRARVHASRLVGFLRRTALGIDSGEKSGGGGW